MKDWTGDKNSVYKTLGSSSHSKRDRETNDFYATEPKAVELLLKEEKFNQKIWEPACGQGHISNALIKNGYDVFSSDLINRNYGEAGKDFLCISNRSWDGDIITNPPYSHAKEFVEKALEIVKNGSKIAMFLKIQFLESKGRKQFFLNTPPHTLYVSSSRLSCAINGDFEKSKKDGSAVAYGWFVWVKGFNGNTIIKWIN